MEEETRIHWYINGTDHLPSRHLSLDQTMVPPGFCGAFTGNAPSNVPYHLISFSIMHWKTRLQNDDGIGTQFLPRRIEVQYNIPLMYGMLTACGTRETAGLL